jgi:AhpD family alkylhydroperoxidase
MEPRINIAKVAPEAYKAMMALSVYVQSTGLDHRLMELIKIRTSQINGCAYCINMHTRDARKSGETEQRIYLLNAWRETNLYTEEEKAVLALTEEVTRISQGGVSDATYKKAEELFGPQTVAHIIMAIVAINGWNRIAITSLTQPD